ncbi:hypothetical protein [Salinifilum ghardaiensis]
MTHGPESGNPRGEAPHGTPHDPGTPHDHDTASGGRVHSGGPVGGEQLSAELRALLEDLGAWTGPREAQGDGGHDRPGECSWCPLCALAGLVRQRHPELLTQLAEALRALRTAVAARFPEDAGATSATEAATAEAADAHRADPAGAEPTSKAERITVRRVDGPVTAAEGSAPGGGTSSVADHRR